jgi:hypothetical protein
MAVRVTKLDEAERAEAEGEEETELEEGVESES